MPSELIQWALTAAVGGLSAVLWYLGRKAIEQQEKNGARLDAMEFKLTNAIAELKVSVALDMGSIRERLARVEGRVEAHSPSK